MIKIELGDAFKLIKEVRSNSIDLILTDPPYDKNLYMASLTDEQKQIMAKEFKRVLKPSGNLALFCGFYCKWKWYNFLIDVGLKFQQELIWVYPNPTLIRIAQHSIKRFIPAHETILWFVKSDNYYFKKFTKTKEEKDKKEFIELTWIKHKSFVGVIRLKGFENTPKEKLGVTPKPLKISDILVKRLCPKGGIILDPFMGTGTFGISAQKYGCNYIGFEIRPEIFEVAKRRLKNLMSFREVGKK